MPSKKKKYNARFPAGRIKKIMQTDEEVGKVAQAVPIIISRTLELFVESLLTKSLEVTTKKNAKTLSPSHLKQCILSESRFDFLKDLVKNIPDMSHAEERELNQNWSTDNSPTANRFQESANNAVAINPGPSNVNRRTKQQGKRDNGQSSDSGSDHELPAKLAARGVFGNGRNPPRPSTNFDEDLRAYVRDSQSKKAAPPPPVNNNFAVPTTVSVPARENNNNSQQRILNFYAETLPDEDDDKDKNAQRANHSSVIQPNPEYCGAKAGSSFGYYKSTPTPGVNPLALAPGVETSSHVPYAKISIMNPPVDVKTSGETMVPKLHIDLSKGFPTPAIRTAQSEPFTPTLLLQPQTPTMIEGQCSKFLTQLSRKNSEESVPGKLGKSDNPGPSGKRNCSNEPPLLLPINLVNKGAFPNAGIKRKSSTVELDEDYDT